MGAEQFPSPSTPQGPYDLSQKFYFSNFASNVSATSITTIYTNNTVATFQVPYTMIVQVASHCGGNAVANTVYLAILDEGGTAISSDGIDGGSLGLTLAANDRKSLSHFAKKQYAPGATCGFRLTYYVSGSNCYIDQKAVVTFAPGYV